MVKPPLLDPNQGYFKVPAPSVARHPAAMLTPRDLRRWISGLPLANPPKAAQMLQQQLRLATRDPQPDARLPALLRVYAEPVEQLLEIVRERQEEGGEGISPLDQLEYSVIDLLNELAVGHLRTANEQFARGRQPAVETLYQAARLLDAALQIRRQHYFALPRDTWQLLLQIYRHAQATGINQQAVERPLRGAHDPASIEGLFFRALVMTLCDPHHHRPDRLLTWQEWITQHVDLLALDILPQGAFAIPVDFSGELLPMAGARRGKPGPDMRYLTVERFLQRLDDDPQAPKGLRQALDDLFLGRKSPEQRQSPRQARNHPFSIYRGRSRIHARLTMLTQGADPGASPPQALACVQINQSRNGSAVRLQGPLDPPLAVGEPVLLEAAPSGGGAALGFAGIVRRIVALDGRSIEIGVEKLPGRLIPVTISGAAAQRLHGDTQALLQQIVESDQHRLLAPQMLYREGDTLTVEGATADYTLRVTGLLSTVQRTALLTVEPTGP